MSEMVDRVFSAIADAVRQTDGLITDEVARAAIEAMRVPTDAMMSAVDCAGEKADWMSGRAWKAGWSAMIDEALK